jgi:hypothetical protein
MKTVYNHPEQVVYNQGLTEDAAPYEDEEIHRASTGRTLSPNGATRRSAAGNHPVRLRCVFAVQRHAPLHGREF